MQTEWMMNMKRFWHKNRKRIIQVAIAVVALILFIFVIPIAINWLYKTTAILPMFAMNWEGKDALSFYGSILGASATIIALTATIKFTRENQKEERKLSIRPYLQTSKFNYTSFEGIPDTKEVIYIDIKPNIITYQGGVPEDISCIIELKDKKVFDRTYSLNGMDAGMYNSNVRSYFCGKYLLCYEIKNCGAGNAINVSLNVNSRCFIPNFCVTTTDSTKIMFILNKELLETSGEYPLKIAFVYYDIASLGKYYQSETIIFTNKNKYGELKTIQKAEGLLTGPMEMS